jgi:hypothetical protein
VSTAKAAQLRLIAAMSGSLPCAFAHGFRLGRLPAREIRQSCGASYNRSRDREARERNQAWSSSPSSKDRANLKAKHFRLGEWNIFCRIALICSSSRLRTGVHAMKRIVASLTIAASIFVLNPAIASAWTCMAVGPGRSATGHDSDVERARVYALQRCEARVGGPCIIIWCRD